MNSLKFAILVAALLSLNAQAEIYKYVDENGRITYSNIPKKGAKKLDLEPISTVPGFKKPQTPTPSSFPKVDAETQRKRDADRRKVLEEELAAEEKLLQDAKKTLAEEGENVRKGDERNYQKYLDRVQKQKDDVARHEQNVEALRKELSGLGSPQKKPTSE